MKLYKYKIIDLRSICSVGLLLFILGTGSTKAVASSPSLWAVEKVNLASNAGLVPDKLKDKYEKFISRGEYAELAMQAFNKTGRQISIRNQTPFFDIESSENRESLVQAYNVGLIKGFGNGIFKPDESITREQVATMLSVFVQLLDPNVDTKPKKTYNFVDGSDISIWALPMVSYCYENNIMSGTGEFRIKPRAYTTRQEAIILIYNLSKKFGLLSQEMLPKTDLDQRIQGKENLPSLEKALGEDNAHIVSQVIGDLPKMQFFENLCIDEDILKISFLNGEDESRIFMASSQEVMGNTTTGFITTGCNTMYPSNKDFTSMFLKLLSASKYKERVEEIFNSTINIASKTYKLNSTELDFGDNEYFRIYSVEYVSGTLFCFELHEKER